MVSKLIQGLAIAIAALFLSAAPVQASCNGQFQAGQVCVNATAGTAEPRGSSSPVLGLPGTTAGTLGFAGSGSGTATVRAQAAAGTPTLLLPNTSGTFAVGATAPLVLSATTGALTCPTCLTGSGGTLTASPPLNITGTNLTIVGAAGQVLAGATPAFTATPTLGASGTLGTLTFGNATSGLLTLRAVTGALGSVTVSLPAATDTLVGKATTDTFTNKTYDTAGTGNSFSINGLAATANTGTGAVVRATAPTISALIVTDSFTATGLVTNAALANPATTVNGQTCTLGSTCTVAAAAGTLTGTTLAANVVNSSLTSVGTLTGGATGAGFTVALSTSTITGTLALANGGTAANLVASNGGIFYSTGSAGAILSGTATARQMLQSGASGAPAWSTATWPATTSVSQILYSSSANVVGEITTGNNGVLVTSGGGVPTISSTIPTATQDNITRTGTLVSGATGSGFTVALASSTITGTLALTNGGAGGSLTASNGGVVYSDASRLQILAGTVTAGQCLLSGSNTAPSWGSCAGGSVVATVTANNTSLTISPNTGAVLAEINLANSNAWTALQTITATNAGAFKVGLGLTDPAFNIDTSTALSATGLNIKSAAAAGGLALAVISSGTNENLTINAKGSGTITLGSVSTGSITVSRALIGSSSILATTTVTATTTMTTGANGGTGGSLTLNGATSGSGVISVAAAAGSAIAFQIPSANGSNLNFLQTNGSGVTSWAAAVTSVTCNGGLTGGAITSTGTCAVDIATGANYFAGTANKILDAAVVYQAEVSVAFAASQTLDFNTFLNARVTATANTTSLTCSNIKAGQSGTISWVQDATGSRTMVAGWCSQFRWAGGSRGVLSTAANAVDALFYACISTTVCYVSLGKSEGN